jgi:hypothetical protein
MKIPCYYQIVLDEGEFMYFDNGYPTKYKDKFKNWERTSD